MGFWQNKDTKRNQIEILGSPARCIIKKSLKIWVSISVSFFQGKSPVLAICLVACGSLLPVSSASGLVLSQGRQLKESLNVHLCGVDDVILF